MIVAVTLSHLYGLGDDLVAGKEAGGIVLGGAPRVARELPTGFGRIGERSARRRRRQPGGPSAEVFHPGGQATAVWRDSLFRRSLLAGDTLAIGGALLFTISLNPRSLGLGWGCVLALVMVMSWAKLSGLYDRDEALIHKTTLDETPKLLQLSTLCTLAVWLADRPILDGSLRRNGALLLWGSLSVLIVAFRSAARSLALRLAPAERCLFIGDAASERRVRAKLSDKSGTNATIVAHLELDQAAPWCGDAFTSSGLADIREFTRTLDIHRAIVVPEAGGEADLLELVCALKAVGVRVSVLSRLLEAVGSSVEFDDLHGLLVMGVRRYALTRSTAAVKRAFDLLAATLVALVALPLIAVIAIAIKLDSRGPVLFRQLRVGRRGRRFEVFKFRTMVRGAETMRASLADRNEAQEGLFKIADDPRITRVGALLRKSCLDELPQLLNIFRGEMSLVGPRPLVIEEDARVEGRLRHRLELLPGITGHWQILGPARVPLREMAAIDYLYVANWSLWTDIKILLRTVPHVIARRGM